LFSVYFTDSNTGWAVGISGTILKTTDGGNNWILHIIITTRYLYSVYFTDLNTGWTVGDYGTILKTADGGNNWIFQLSASSYGLSSTYFTDSNIGWAVGDYGTILKTTNGGVSFINDNTFAPTGFYLYQNYPNPFNPSTRIQYAVSSWQFVSVKVYDILGKEIETLVSEEKPAGTYEVTWNAMNMPSGVYFYQIKAGSFIETKKMILLK
jgi:hypothetical protein